MAAAPRFAPLSLLLLTTLAAGCDGPVPEGTARAGDLRTVPQAAHRACGLEDENGATLAVEGIDVSSYQATIDWDAVAATAVRFAIVRVSDGTGTLDDQFDRNWTEMARVGMTRGAYQYFHPGADAGAQAALFIRRIEEAGGLRPGDLPPVIDVETDGRRTPAQIEDAVQAWIDPISDWSGEVPIVYTGAYFWDDTGLGDRFADHPLWTANYTTNPCPWTADPWENWTFWQYTDSGAVDGVTGAVDRDVFRGDEPALELFANQPRHPGAAACAGLNRMAELTLTLDCAAWTRDTPVSRGEWLSQLADALGYGALEAEPGGAPACDNPFGDLGSLSAASQARIAALTHLDRGAGTVADGTGGVLNPQSAAARCQAAGWVARAWNLPVPSETPSFSDLATLDASCQRSVAGLVGAGLLTDSTAPFSGDRDAGPEELGAWLGGAVVRLGVAPLTAVELATCGAACEPACAAGEVCSGGVCVAGCTDACPEGAALCDSETAHVTCARDATGCSVWSAPTPCGERMVCADGACVMLPEEPAPDAGTHDTSSGGDSGSAGDTSSDAGSQPGGADDVGPTGTAHAGADDAGCAASGDRTTWSGVGIVAVLGIAVAARRRGREQKTYQPS